MKTYKYKVCSEDFVKTIVSMCKNIKNFKLHFKQLVYLFITKSINCINIL